MGQGKPTSNWVCPEKDYFLQFMEVLIGKIYLGAELSWHCFFLHFFFWFGVGFLAFSLFFPAVFINFPIVFASFPALFLHFP